MGDLLGLVLGDLRERGLSKQADISAFVRNRTGWKISQQMVSNILNRKVKDPQSSVHVMWMLVSLGRGPDGEKRSLAEAPATARDTPRLDSFSLEDSERAAMARRITERLRHHGVTYTDTAKILGISVDDTVHLMLNGTNNVAVLKRLLDSLPTTDGKKESMDYIVWGPSRFTLPVEGSHKEHIEAARARTKAAAKREGT